MKDKMAIEFIVDSFHEEEKDKLKKIIETIKRRPVKVDKKARFLRKFTLAAMGQYPKKEMLKHHQEMLKNLKEPVVVKKPVAMPKPVQVKQEIKAIKPVEIIPKAPEML